MDTKLFITIIVIVVVVCLASLLALVLIIHSTDRKDQICLPGETGQLTCGSTTDLLHKYLEKVRLIINIII